MQFQTNRIRAIVPYRHVLRIYTEIMKTNRRKLISGIQLARTPRPHIWIHHNINLIFVLREYGLLMKPSRFPIALGHSCSQTKLLAAVTAVSWIRSWIHLWESRHWRLCPSPRVSVECFVRRAVATLSRRTSVAILPNSSWYFDRAHCKTSVWNYTMRNV